MKWVLLICFLWLANAGFTQDSLKTKAIAAVVQLDSVTIVATRGGFSVEDFIRLVQTDRSLYQAFRNLRFSSYQFDTEMEFHDRHDIRQDMYRSRNRQIFDGRCRTIQILSEEASDRFRRGRKLKPRYYTYALYDRVFLTHDTICEQQSITSVNASAEPALEKQVSELRKLIFTPGERSNVPLIGRKTEIFSDEMIDLYDFTISSEMYTGIPAYVFTARVKDIYQARENKTVFKELITYFSRQDFQVLARTYTLSQRTAAYMFDVRMEVDLVKAGERYFPEKVVYDGQWDIPTRKKEIGSFTIKFMDFK